MKQILFYAHSYWEVHWLHRVVKALNAPILCDSPPAYRTAKALNLPTTADENSADILVTCVYHMPKNYRIISSFAKKKKSVIILQHAWDSQIQCFKNFWELNMNYFDIYFTGCTQDKEWLTKVYSTDHIMNPGIPRLDDLWQVKHESKTKLKPIYQEIGHDQFYLADIPPAPIYSPQLEGSYLHNLPQESPLPIVYKMHPGGNYDTGLEWLSQHGPSNIIFLDDDITDPLKTYRLMKASSGVVSLESFLSIEATLLEKPVIFYDYELLPEQYFSAVDRIGYSDKRLPKAMSSSIKHPTYTDMQQKVSSWYRFDGHNTDRVAELLELVTGLD